jgi:MOSC domain-containing protein YiiM
MKQQGIKDDPQMLQTIQRENGGNLGVMCTVLAEGFVRVGDGVTLA